MQWISGPVTLPAGTPFPHRITLGIGSITNAQDGTSASFALSRYLRERPLETKCGVVTVGLVDYPTEADFSVAGKIVGDLHYTFADPTAEGVGLYSTGVVLGVVGGLSFVAGGALGIANASKRNRDLPAPPLLIAGAALVAAGLAMATLPRAIHRSHHYDGELRGSFVVRHRGRKIGDVSAVSKVAERARSPLPIQERAFEPLWRGLVDALRRHIDARCARGG